MRLKTPGCVAEFAEISISFLGFICTFDLGFMPFVIIFMICFLKFLGNQLTLVQDLLPLEANFLFFIFIYILINFFFSRGCPMAGGLPKPKGLLGLP